MGYTIAEMQTKDWHERLEREIARVREKISSLGYLLEDDQPHVKGERFLLGGSTKVVLHAIDKNGVRVVVKASTSPEGVLEIKQEKRVRDMLGRLSFAADTFKVPQEIHYDEDGAGVLFLTEYIEQKEVFAERSLEERFFMALRALEAQEAFHATTYEHLREVKEHFPLFDANAYISSTRGFARDLESVPGILPLLHDVAAMLDTNRTRIERYGNYLSHSDFVPHNIRVQGRTIWLLDYTSIHFGNKYESWARLINYMLIHDTELAEALLSYVRSDRGEDEAEALRLMRAYKAAFLTAFYARSLRKTDGNYRALTELRVALWMGITRKLLDGAPFPEADAERYIRERDTLRSDEEKARQRGFDVR
jgi:hypothetical protein